MPALTRVLWTDNACAQAIHIALSVHVRTADEMDRGCQVHQPPCLACSLRQHLTLHCTHSQSTRPKQQDVRKIWTLGHCLQDGHYGEQRMFASMGWGLFSALSGYLVHKFSIYTAFQLFFALTAFAVIPVCFLKFHLKPPLAQVHTNMGLPVTLCQCCVTLAVAL